MNSPFPIFALSSVFHKSSHFPTATDVSSWRVVRSVPIHVTHRLGVMFVVSPHPNVRESPNLTFSRIESIAICIRNCLHVSLKALALYLRLSDQELCPGEGLSIIFKYVYMVLLLNVLLMTNLLSWVADYQAAAVL